MIPAQRVKDHSAVLDKSAVTPFWELTRRMNCNFLPTRSLENKLWRGETRSRWEILGDFEGGIGVIVKD